MSLVFLVTPPLLPFSHVLAVFASVLCVFFLIPSPNIPYLFSVPSCILELKKGNSLLLSGGKKEGVSVLFMEKNWR